MDAGQVHQLVAAAAAVCRHGAAQQLHRESGPVGDLSVATGEPVVEGGFTCVGHTEQRHRKGTALAVLAATGMVSGHGKGTAGLHLGIEVGMDRLGELFDDLLTLKMV